jgi:hypothetical protein
MVGAGDGPAEEEFGPGWRGAAAACWPWAGKTAVQPVVGAGVVWLAGWGEGDGEERRASPEEEKAMGEAAASVTKN